MVGIPQATKMQLIPLSEMTPGMAGAIRNQVIESVVAQASRELSLPYDKLLVRDVRSLSDLQMYEVLTTALAQDDWIYVATTTVANAWTAVTANPATMADNRYVAIYGVRNGLPYSGSVAGGTAGVAGDVSPYSDINLVRINVGGSDKVIWDVTCTQLDRNGHVALCPSAVIIPQNSTYTIFYKRSHILADVISHLQLVGVVVEPRGVVLSP